MLPDKIKDQVQFRQMPIEVRASEDGSALDISFSSEAPVERWFGIETLSHAPGAMVMDRAAQGLPFLADHDTTELIGRAENVRVENGKGRASIRFSASEEAQGMKRDMTEGIRPDVSVGYQILEYTITEGQAGAADRILVTSWRPYEISSVTVPADFAVGVGRALELLRNPEADHPTNPARAGSPEVRMEPKSTPPAAPEAAHVIQLQPAPPAAERNSIGEALAVRAVAARHGLEKEADALLQTRTLDEARREIMGLISDRAAAPVVSTPAVDLTPKEAKAWSLVRAIDSLCNQREGRPADCFEREVSDELAKHMPSGYQQRGGIFIPMQLQKRTGLDSLTATAGNELKFTQPGELIDLLRNEMVCAQLGARTLSGLTSPVGFPAQTGAGTAYWLGENGGVDATESELTTALRTLTPKTLIATTKFSRQLVRQSSTDVENLVRQDFAAVHARALDYAAIHLAGGSNDPTGIYNTTGVSTQAMGAMYPTWTLLLQMIGKVLASNALTGSLGWATTPLMAAKLAAVLKASGQPAGFIWDGKLNDGSIGGYRALASAQIKSTMSTLAATGGTEHGVLFGNWADLIFGLFGTMELIGDPITLAAQGMIKLTSFQMGDVMLRHPASFCVSTGADLTDS
jgi:HK97 family phage major capsid protein